jgi:tetratricopeptide (TPR) repeat protein
LPGMGNRPGVDGARPSQLPARGTAQERRGDLENRLSQRDQTRDNLQDHRDQVREDWHDNYDNIHDLHDDWHHGCWNGNAGDWWHHMWDDHTALMAFGATMWGINRAAYGFGYWGYDNPYYTESYPISEGYAIDYSQPIAVDEAAAALAATPTTPEAPAPGIADFNAARDAFYKKDYAAALASTNKALTAMPNDPIIHEFRALVLFAQGKYREAAAGLYSVLSVGPGWDWTTMISLYADQETYTAQLRKLEAYARENPKSAEAKFVLAYHYTTTNNKDAATAQLSALYKINPEDMLVKQLLLMSGGPEAIGAPSTPETPATTAAAPTIPAADVVGKWNAASKSSKFSLDLTKDGTFVWSYSQGTQSQSVKGVYALDGNVLAMEPETGGTMLAEITPPKSGSFDFQMLGAPPGDPGLRFAKSK